MDNTIVLATGNTGKIKEFRALLSSKTCISQSDLGITTPDETGCTFIENALLKARHASRLSKLPAIADDSGLVVPALMGRPGIYSSRFAGVDATDEDNIKHLLYLLKEEAPHETTPKAFFYCAIVFIQHADDPTPLLGVGRLNGEIIRAPRGVHGFGYDPVFYLPTTACTLAELSKEKKNTLSHRARAVKALTQLIDA
ncbi:MAG: RdgB/HAM1 family non-canonical purine NTP pyrophosphatase [Legionellaceae bacterium]|nr:RdgB/HAM1 family non-canonical purine NTP pyrophosphatase [Legionellaceae bacterium]